jgi:hypothetical protein
MYVRGGGGGVGILQPEVWWWSWDFAAGGVGKHPESSRVNQIQHPEEV